RGIRVRGRAEDAEGAPQAHLALQATLQADARAFPAPQTFYVLRCGADGAFAHPARFAAGRYAVRAPDGAVSVEPAEFALSAEEPAKVLTFKITRAAAGEVISGRIVDDSGRPVAQAIVQAAPAPGFRGGAMFVTAGKDGRFEVERKDADLDGPMTLSADRAGYERASTSAPVRWGARDVELVMRKGGVVEVLVLDGDHGRPLEDYGLRCFPTPETSRLLVFDTARLREAGRHADGLCVVPGVTRGSYWLIVEPLGEDRHASAPHRFEVSDSGAPRQVIAVFRSVARTVRVRKSNGAPVAGTAVELLRRVSADRQVDLETKVASIGSFAMNGGSCALRVTEGRTDEMGSLVLRGPPRESLFLRVLGPGHQPLVREVTFDVEHDLEVVVAAGATFSGKIGPPELLPQLHARDGLGRRTGEDEKPGVSLRFAGDPSREFPPAREAPPLGADGSFRLEGAPPGEWEVLLHVSTATSGRAITVGRVTLTDGEHLRRDYDLPYLVKGSVEGTVTLDGAPLEGALISFFGRLGAPLSDQRVHLQNVRCDAQGRYRAALMPGDYRATIQRKSGQKYAARVVASDALRVAAGASAVHDVALRTSKLTLRVTASDGATPLEGIRLELNGPLPDWSISTGTTSSEGVVVLDDVQAGTFVVNTWPRSLATDEARAELVRSGKDPKASMVEVGAIRVTPPESSATIALPPSSGY
ncbi:MAG TPA: carboxypeptidase-like regulatory domain-containing protein, partial [Planctomycetota bacterium]|nr:carboxypeptidase-like regulatory domain-containing protein [Planctomycetota bacterium]